MSYPIKGKVIDKNELISMVINKAETIVLINKYVRPKLACQTISELLQKIGINSQDQYKVLHNGDILLIDKE